MVQNDAFMRFGGVFDGKGEPFAANCADIADLPAAFCIKRGFLEHQGNIAFTVGKLAAFAVRNDCGNFGLFAKGGVACKFRSRHIFRHIAGAFPSLGTCAFVRGACADFLLLNKLFKAFFVNGKPFFGEQFFGQINREAVGVGKQKCVFARQAVPGKILQFFFEQGKAGVNRSCEVFFFRTDNIDNEIALFHKVRVSGFIFLNDGFGDFIKESMVNA